MIEAPAQPDVTLSRPISERGLSLLATANEAEQWRVTYEGPIQASPTTTAAPAAALGTHAEVNKLGNYHCWNRQYDVQTGRWTTPDPVIATWVNASAYVSCRPLMLTDATGLEPRVTFAEAPTASLGSCGEYSISADVELDDPAGATGGYLITSCRKGVLEWACPMQGERTEGNDDIGGHAMTRVDRAYYVPPGATKAMPDGSTTLDSLSDSGESRPDTHGSIFMTCKAFYIDGLTEQDILGKGFVKSRTFEEVLDDVDPADITGRRQMSRTAESESDRLGSPSSYRKGSKAPITWFSLDLDWDCCCNRDNGSFKVRWGDSEKKMQDASGLKVKLKRTSGETTDELDD